MSDPMSGEATSVAQPAAERAEKAIPSGASDERSRISPPAVRARRRILAVVGLALVVAVVGLITTDPFAGPGKSSSGVADNASTTALTTVKRQSLSQQTQVSGTLGYAGSSSIRVLSGTAPSAVQQASQQVTSAEAMLTTARATLVSDTQALADHHATLAAARAKEQVDCAGDGAAEATSANSSPDNENNSPSGDAGGSSC